MKSNPVGWFEIYVKDMKRAKAFYEVVFQTKLEKLDTPAGDISEMWSFPMQQNGAGAAGALVSMEGGPFGERHHRLFRVRRLLGRGRPRPACGRQGDEGEILDRSIRLHHPGHGRRRQRHRHPLDAVSGAATGEVHRVRPPHRTVTGMSSAILAGALPSLVVSSAIFST